MDSLSVSSRRATIEVMTLPASPHAPMRSDARRNRERVLVAAHEAFGAREASPSMAEISRRAGVGMATLYRNFPTRLALLEALYATEADIAFAASPADATGAGPGDALRAWLVQFFDFAAGKRHVAAELLTHVDADSPIFDDTRTRVIAAGTPLFDAALRAGEVRGELTLDHVLRLLVSVAGIDGGRAYQEPMLATVLDGLAPARHTGIDAGSRSHATPRS